MGSMPDPSKPCSGTSVLVAGAGIGGIMTALECHRRGCSVRIFERSALSSTQGDSIGVGQTALRSIEQHWPELDQRQKEVAYHPLVGMYNQKGEELVPAMNFNVIMAKQIPVGKKLPDNLRHMRPKLHMVLLQELEKCGMKVEYGKEIASFFDANEQGKAGVTLKDGSSHTADLVVAADGIRSKSQFVIDGREVSSRPSGSAVWRVAFPVEIAMKDPVVAKRFNLREDGKSVLEHWSGEGMYGIVWRNEDVMSWAMNHPDDGSAAESWSNRGNLQAVLDFTSKIPNFAPELTRLIEITPKEHLVDWKLMWRDPQPTWTSPSGKIVQVGDAAHTFLPTSGYGATSAIEDAVSLAACLAMSGNDVANATRVHNLLRFERISLLQAMGVSSHEAWSSTKGKKEPSIPKWGSWTTDHDPEQYAIENYGAALAHLLDGKEFKNTNVPAGLKYEPWTYDSMIEKLRKGEKTMLNQDLS